MSNITHYDGCWNDPKHHACAVREIERLRKDVVHWREARRFCIEAGDMMKEEIERLRSERDAYSNEITGTLMPEIERLRNKLDNLDYY